MSKINIPQRIDELLVNELKKIRLERIKNGRDTEMRSFPRLTRALVRHPKFQDIKKDMILSEFLKDDRGQFTVFNLLTIMVVGFLAVIMFAGLIYVMGLLTGVMHQAGLSNEVNSGLPGYSNITLAADNTFGKVNDSIQALRLVALTMIFSMVMGMLITNFLQKIHPAFFFIYVLIVMLCVFLAPPISNAYEQILQTNTFGGILPSFTGANWFLLNLPVVITVLGLLGGVFLFINIVRQGGEEQLR